jgi:endonuclease/exonuclease/phosphatase family metal-dependent hydrolase
VPSTTPENGSEELRVLTFNVRMLPYFSDLKRARRIADAIRAREPAYDVVCLQEVFCDRARAIFARELKDPFPYIDEPSGGDRWRFNSGLFTASRHRPVNRAFTGYGLGGIFGADFLAEKGALALELELSGDTRVHLFHTHVQSLALYRRTRREQLSRLSRFVHDVMGQASRERNRAALLLGDLNVPGGSGSPADSDEYEDLLAVLGRPRDLFREANPADPGLTHPATEPTQRLDYVLAFDRHHVGEESRPLRTWTVHQAKVNPHGEEGVSLSDHLAVEAELKLESASSLQ